MRFDFDGRKVDFQIIEASNVTSKHSLKRLQHLTVEAVISGEELNQELLRLIDICKKKGLSSDDGKNIIKQWRIEKNSYRYNYDSPLYTHTIQMEELEVLEVSSLEIGEVVLEPYYYEEYFHGDVLNIQAKSLMTKEQRALFKNILNTEVSVIRHGINEHPRQMFLQNGAWSEFDANIKHEIVLQDTRNESDSGQGSGFNVFQLFGAASRQSADNQALLELLLNTLIEKNILSNEEVNKICDDAIEQRKQNLYDFYKVNDIDE